MINRGRRAGLALHGLHAQGYWREPGGDQPAALILGYATSPPHAWSRALDVLADLLRRSGTKNLDLSSLVCWTVRAPSVGGMSATNSTSSVLTMLRLVDRRAEFLGLFEVRDTDNYLCLSCAPLCGREAEHPLLADPAF